MKIYEILGISALTSPSNDYQGDGYGQTVQRMPKKKKKEPKKKPKLDPVLKSDKPEHLGQLVDKSV